MERVFNKTHKIIAVLLLLIMMITVSSQVFAVSLNSTQTVGGSNSSSSSGILGLIKKIQAIFNAIKSFFGKKPPEDFVGPYYNITATKTLLMNRCVPSRLKDVNFAESNWFLTNKEETFTISFEVGYRDEVYFDYKNRDDIKITDINQTGIGTYQIKVFAKKDTSINLKILRYHQTEYDKNKFILYQNSITLESKNFLFKRRN